MPKLSKDDVAFKIWESEGFDYYFTQYDPKGDLIREACSVQEWQQLEPHLKAYRDARENLILALDKVRLSNPTDF